MALETVAEGKASRVEELASEGVERENGAWGWSVGVQCDCVRVVSGGRVVEWWSLELECGGGGARKLQCSGGAAGM